MSRAGSPSEVPRVSPAPPSGVPLAADPAAEPAQPVPPRAAPPPGPRAPRRLDDPDPAVLDRAFAAGTEEALRAVFDRYGRVVYSYCRHLLGADADAAEAAQDVFVAAWRSRHRFDPGRGTLAAWLLGIARHRSLDALRRRARRDHPVDPALLADWDSAAEHGPDAVAARFVLADALASLPARAQQVVTLAVAQGHSHHDVAARLGLPLGTVKSDVRRSLIRLRRHLVEAEVAGVDP